MKIVIKPSTEEKRRAINIFKTCYQGSYIPEYWDNDPKFERVKLKPNRDITVCGGIDKFCLVVKDFDWVIKFDIRIHDASTPTIIEAKNYQRAQSCGLEKYFAPTYYIGSYDNIKIVLQLKLDVSTGRTNRYLQSVIDDYDCYYDSDYSSDSEEFDSDELEDEEMLDAIFGNADIVNFCYKYYINDLHATNFGWDGDRAFITDFCGYHD